MNRDDSETAIATEKVTLTTRVITRSYMTLFSSPPIAPLALRTSERRVFGRAETPIDAMATPTKCPKASRARDCEAKEGNVHSRSDEASAGYCTEKHKREEGGVTGAGMRKRRRMSRRNAKDDQGPDTGTTLFLRRARTEEVIVCGHASLAGQVSA